MQLDVDATGCEDSKAPGWLDSAALRKQRGTPQQLRWLPYAVMMVGACRHGGPCVPVGYLIRVQATVGNLRLNEARGRSCGDHMQIHGDCASAHNRIAASATVRPWQKGPPTPTMYGRWNLRTNLRW